MKFEGTLSGREVLQRGARIDVGYEIKVRSEHGEFEAEIVNLSSRGFRLRSNAALKEGWEVVLEKHREEPVKAVIRWVTGLDAGGVFLEAVAL